MIVAPVGPGGVPSRVQVARFFCLPLCPVAVRLPVKGYRVAGVCLLPAAVPGRDPVQVSLARVEKNLFKSVPPPVVHSPETKLIFSARAGCLSVPV